MGFGYRQGIIELIYAMVTCCPDTSFLVIKLSQYSTKPTQIHFEAVKNIYWYLNATKYENIYYWRDQSRANLLIHPNPECKLDINYDEHSVRMTRKQSTKDILLSAVNLIMQAIQLTADQ